MRERGIGAPRTGGAVEARDQRASDRALGAGKVGSHRAVEAPLALEHVEQVRVLAGVDAVDAGEAAHHRARAALRHRGFERRQVYLADGLFADHVVARGRVQEREPDEVQNRYDRLHTWRKDRARTCSS